MLYEAMVRIAMLILVDMVLVLLRVLYFLLLS